MATPRNATEGATHPQPGPALAFRAEVPSSGAWFLKHRKCAPGRSQELSPHPHGSWCEAGVHAARPAPSLLSAVPHAPQNAHAHRSRLASPKVRCRGVVSLSWGARGRAPLRKQGGHARRARRTSSCCAQEQEQEQGGGGLAGSRRADRDESSSRKCCATRCMRNLIEMRLCARENACMRR